MTLSPLSAASDYVVLSAVFPLTPTVPMACAPLSIQDDDLIEDPETVVISLAASTGESVDVVNIPQATVTIEDNDGTYMQSNTYVVYTCCQMYNMV